MTLSNNFKVKSLFDFYYIDIYEYMAIDKKYINIRFPFQKSDEGQYLQLNKTTKEAIKSDLLHLLLTNKGDRLYMPDFGTNLYKYVFEQNDAISHGEIKREINESVKKYIPGLVIDDMEFLVEDFNRNVVAVNIKFSVTSGVFKSTDYVTVTF